MLVGQLEKMGASLAAGGGEDGEALKGLWMVNNGIYMEGHVLGEEEGNEGGIGKVREAER